MEDELQDTIPKELGECQVQVIREATKEEVAVTAMHLEFAEMTA